MEALKHLEKIKKEMEDVKEDFKFYKGYLNKPLSPDRRRKAEDLLTGARDDLEGLKMEEKNTLEQIASEVKEHEAIRKNTIDVLEWFEQLHRDRQQDALDFINQEKGDHEARVEERERFKYNMYTKQIIELLIDNQNMNYIEPEELAGRARAIVKATLNEKL